jgi:uncharacterized membrane protein YcaP (DUF421 family)
MLYDGSSRIVTLVVATLVAYGALVLSLRLSGKRTLSKLNAFDFVVTIAFGSILATASLSRSVPLVDAIVSLALLVLLQFLVSSASDRWRTVKRAVKSSPRALVVDGEVIDRALEEERVAMDDLAQAVRRQGHGSFSELDLVALETDGTISVVADVADRSALLGIDLEGEWQQSPERSTG